MADLLSGALDYQRPIIKAFCAWAKTQDLTDTQFLSTLASINGLTVGLLARDYEALEHGIYLATTQIREVAKAAKLQMIGATGKESR
jgi:hypothetical protein